MPVVGPVPDCHHWSMRKEILGYDPASVDTFLSRCFATPGVYRSTFPQLRGRIPSGARVTPEDVASVRFRKRLVGYAIRDVDDLLDDLQQVISLTTWQSPAPPAGAAAEARTISLVEAEQASLARTAERR